MVVCYVQQWFALVNSVSNKSLVKVKDIYNYSHKYSALLASYLEKYQGQTDIKQQVTLQGLINGLFKPNLQNLIKSGVMHYG